MQEPVDSNDAPYVDNIVYDVNGLERRSWKFCNSISLPRSEVVFFTQIFIIFVIIGTSLYKLCFNHLNCDEKPIWISLLSSAVGFILPNPQL